MRRSGRRYRYRHPRELEHIQAIGLADVPNFTPARGAKPADCRDCGARFDANAGPVGARRVLCPGCRSVLEDEASQLGHELKWWIDDLELEAWVRRHHTKAPTREAA